MSRLTSRPWWRAVLIAWIAGVSCTDIAAQHWPQFRGTAGGVSPDDSRLPDTWSTTDNVAWVRAIPGRSWSSPIVWGDHVFVVSAVNPIEPRPRLLAPEAYRGASSGGTMNRADLVRETARIRWVLYDVDVQSGRVRWERVLHEGVPPMAVHVKNSFASETPVTDGKRVYVYLGYVGLFAYDMSGTRVWATLLPALNTGNYGYTYGPAASPALDGDRLFIVNDNEERSFVAAFDARSGKELWRTPRDEASNWATPFVWRNELRTELVTVGDRKVRSYSLDGALLWDMTVGTTRTAPTPFAHDGMLYVSAGYYSDPRRPVLAIRPGATGDISLHADARSNAFIAWSHPTLAATYPSALAVGGHYYTLLDRGLLTAHDAKTGAEIYARRRIAQDAGTFSASPWSYNGKLFVLSEDGDTFVIQAGPTYRLLGKNSLGELTLATPAVANGSLFIRTATKLYRIARRERDALTR